MRKLTMIAMLSLVLAVICVPVDARADDGRWEIGPRLILVTAGGEPTNDLTGGGIYGRYHLNDQWKIGFAVDSMTGDFEEPYRLLGIASTEVVDGTVDLLVFSASIEREYGAPADKSRWFWNAGLGFSSPDVTDVTGLIPGGGTFDLTTDAGTETLLMLSGGLRRRLGKNWNLEVGVRFDQHFTDWTIRDRDSAGTATLSNYNAYGAQLGVTYRF
ncbi:MAG: outer membrane beta-barrel protein [Acidobacteria bacterium]|uniref:Outer membrane beta-barrel protein n=1 Tax=Candidatus Polarisedimenticola svalbardensis TaxID=2886004 RepID=A0A8J7C3K1_9BACT|nr:outer membrane beta-barrel protein [Candidatus Polarisedimenticola svalbardensis]